MDPSGPWSDRLVLWTVTGSNGCLVSALKQRRSTLFFPLYGIVPPFFNPLSKITLSLFLTLKPSLNHSRLLPQSSLSSLPLSLITITLLQLSPDFFLTLSKSQSPSRLCLSPLSSSQLTLSRSSLPLSLVLVAAHSVPRRCHSHLVLYYL